MPLVICACRKKHQAKEACFPIPSGKHHTGWAALKPKNPIYVWCSPPSCRASFWHCLSEGEGSFTPSIVRSFQILRGSITVHFKISYVQVPCRFPDLCNPNIWLHSVKAILPTLPCNVLIQNLKDAVQGSGSSSMRLVTVAIGTAIWFQPRLSFCVGLFQSLDEFFENLQSAIHQGPFILF